MKKQQPQIEQFTNYPLIAIRNSSITIQWRVKNALFVFINNGIGLKKTKGIKLTTLSKSSTYKLTAFGLFGIKTKYLYPITYNVNNNVPSPQLINKQVEGIEITSTDNIKLKKAKSFKQISQLNIKYKELRICPDIESLHDDLEQLATCQSTSEIEKLKDSYHV